MEYREDMMLNLEKSPGMCSDRPGTTPKRLDLVGPSAVWWRGVRGTSNISQVWPTPPFCPVADCPRYPGGPSTFEIFTLQTK